MIRHKATVICDDFRVESNGKLILLGVLVLRVQIPKSPATVPLCFFHIFEADRAGLHKIKLEVKRRADERLVVGGNLEFRAGSPGATLYSVTKFLAVELSEGDYIVRFKTEDDTEIDVQPFSAVVELEGKEDAGGS